VQAPAFVQCSVSGRRSPEGGCSSCGRDAGTRQAREVGSKIREPGNRETGTALGLAAGEPNGVAWRCGGQVLRPFENLVACLVNAIAAFNTFPFEGTILFQAD